MLEVLDQLHALGDLDPQARQQLIDDLRHTKPSLWPAMVQQFRAALAFRRQLRQQDAHDSAAERTGTQLVSHSHQIQHTPGAADAAGDSLIEVRPANAPGRPTAGRQDKGNALPGVVIGYAGVKRPPPLPGGAAQQPAAPTRQLSSAPPALPTYPPAAAAALTSNRMPPASSPLPAPAGTQPSSVPTKPDGAPPLPAHQANANQPTPNGAGGGRVSIATAPQSVDDRAEAPGTADWRRHLGGVIRDLEQQTQQAPRTTDEVNRHAALRILYLAAGRRQDALRAIPGISPTAQDFWSKQLYGLATYLDSSQQSDAGRRATLAKRHLCEAASRLGELGLLTIQNLALCTEVSSYGVYEVFDELVFSPGQEVLLYAEINNFKSEQTEKGFRTSLRSSYQIRDSNNNRIDGREFSVTEDHCRNQRQDFFMRYFIRLPKQIDAGTYTLELSIEDTLANKIGQSSIVFHIKDAQFNRR